MTAVRCRRCGKFWAFTGNPDLFEVISKWCPLCIEKAAPRLRMAVATTKPRKNH